MPTLRTKDGDLRPLLGRIEAPTLVIAGERDVAVPLASSRATCDSIRGARLEVIAGAGHLPVLERPDEVARKLLEFLEPDSLAPQTLAELYQRGLDTRRAVLGSSYVERALANTTDFDRDFQELLTRTAWGTIWPRPGLDRRTRSLVTIAMLVALQSEHELELHIRASRNTGVTPAELSELLLHTTAYVGIPAANVGFRIAKRVASESQ